MKRMNKLMSMVVVAAAAVASPAQAVETIFITGSSGIFGNDAVTCSAGATTCAFTNTFNFLTPTGFNLANATISTPQSTTNPTSNVDFTSVLLNGMAFTLTAGGTGPQFGSLSNVMLTPGVNNQIVVNGTNSGDGTFSGTLNFATVSAVPEAGTWAMMLIGFGAVGFSMRRRKHTGMRLMQVA